MKLRWQRWGHEHLVRVLAFAKLMIKTPRCALQSPLLSITPRTCCFRLAKLSSSPRVKVKVRVRTWKARRRGASGGWEARTACARRPPRQPGIHAAVGQKRGPMRFRRPTRQVAQAPHCQPSCQNEFLDTLRLLGARLSVGRQRTAGTVSIEVQPVYLRCWQQSWEQVFGEIENVFPYRNPFQQHCSHRWQHDWPWGCVTCLGSLQDGPQAGTMVTLHCAIVHGKETQFNFRSRADGRVVIQVLSRSA